MAQTNFPPIFGRSFGGKVTVQTQVVNPTLSTLSLSSNQLVIGASQGALIGSVIGLTSGSALLLTNSNSGAVQLVAGTIQVGPTPPRVGSTFNIQLAEVLSGSPNSPNITTLLISESYAVPTINTPASIPGTPQVNVSITAIDAIWNNGVTSLAYQWKSAGVNASGTGATTLTYTPVIGDLGNTLTITVTATNLGGTSAPSTSAASAPVIAAPLTNSSTYIVALAA